MELFDRIIDTFSKKIDYVRRASMGVPKTFAINLALPLIDQPYHISGNIYYVWSSPNATDYIDIKVNKSSEPALRCVRQTGLITPYDKLLITTPDVGQTGDMVLLYGTEAPELLSLIDNRSATLADTAAILNELQGDQLPENWAEMNVNVIADEILAANATRKSFTIQSKLTNTENIYIGFDNTVATNKWWAELQPGQSCGADDYCGPVWGVVPLIAQLVGYAEV